MKERLVGNHKVIFGDAHEEDYVFSSSFVDEHGIEQVEIFIEPSSYIKNLVGSETIDPRTSTIRLTFPKFHVFFLCSIWLQHLAS